MEHVFFTKQFLLNKKVIRIYCSICTNKKAYTLYKDVPNEDATRDDAWYIEAKIKQELIEEIVNKIESDGK